MLQVDVQLLTHTLSTYYYNLAGVALLTPMPHDAASRPSSPTHRPPRASITHAGVAPRHSSHFLEQHFLRFSSEIMHGSDVLPSSRSPLMRSLRLSLGFA